MSWVSVFSTGSIPRGEASCKFLEWLCLRRNIICPRQVALFPFYRFENNQKGNEDNGNEERDKENNKSGHKENNGNKKTTSDKPHCTVSFHLSGSEWILGQCHLKRQSLPMTSKLAENATDALDGSQGHHICIKYLGIILFCRNSREILHCWLCSWMNKPPPTHIPLR